MSLETLTPRLARRLQVERTQGVLVTRVEPFGAAARAGIRLNDIILAVNGTGVESVADLEHALERFDMADGVRLTVLTGPNKRFVFLRVNE